MGLPSALNLNSPSSSPLVLSNLKIKTSENSVKIHRIHNHLHFHLPHIGNMHNSLHLHLHLPHFPLQLHSKKGGGGGGNDLYKDIPKGCMALYVGQGDEFQRFVIPVEHVNHPLFEKLLKEAEEEYGFEQKGIITIPCHVSDFQRVHDLIDREQHHSHAHGLCFR